MEFFQLVLKAISLLISYGVSHGDRQVHYCSGNTVEDLVLRTAAMILGSVFVTVNWQSDSVEQVLYKIQLTSSKLIFVDDLTPSLNSIELGQARIINVKEITSFQPCDFQLLLDSLVDKNNFATVDDVRCVIFTSGTTGHPKGVELTFDNYLCNRLSFETLLSLESISPDPPLWAVLVNPLHHTNSTSLSDWALRRPGSRITLFDKYSTPYWSIVVRSVLGLEGEGEVEVYELRGAMNDDYSQTDLSTFSPRGDTNTNPPSEMSAPLQLIYRLLSRTSPIHATDQLRGASTGKGWRVVMPLVSRHIDFLSTLADSLGSTSSSSSPLPSSLGVSPSLLKLCLSRCVLLLGSAPVGPTTTQRLLRLADNLPTVRFGSTETTLQVCGIPPHLPRDLVLTAFQRGWNHTIPSQPSSSPESPPPPESSPSPGYYIGRDHRPHTWVKVVRSIDPSSFSYLHPCSEGETGYLITRGAHVMRSYVGNEEATRKVLVPDPDPEGSRSSTCGVWYLGLGDMGFWLKGVEFDSSSSLEGNEIQGHDLYWQTRDSQMLIRGGSNYSFEQVNAELTRFLSQNYQSALTAASASFRLAVCGLRILSEHEDECCVMIEIAPQTSSSSISSSSSSVEYTEEREATEKRSIEELAREIQSSFLSAARLAVSKGSKPDRVWVMGPDLSLFPLSPSHSSWRETQSIPMVLSKGIVSVPEMNKLWKQRVLEEISACTPPSSTPSS